MRGLVPDKRFGVAEPRVEVYVLNAAYVVSFVDKHTNIEGLTLDACNVMTMRSNSSHAVPCTQQLNVGDRSIVRAAAIPLLRISEIDGPRIRGRRLFCLLLAVVDDEPAKRAIRSHVDEVIRAVEITARRRGFRWK